MSDLPNEVHLAVADGATSAAALAAESIRAMCAERTILRARVKALEGGLLDLLNDTQHATHECGESCVVHRARRLLEEVEP